MPRLRGGRLTAFEVDALGPGLHSDGGNLYLRVKTPSEKEKVGRRSWVFIYRSPDTGKQREAGLGRAGKGKDSVSLASARDKADEGRALLRQTPPVDPLSKWKAPAPSGVPTFGEAAKTFIDLNAAAWKSSLHASQWRHSIDKHCGPIAALPVNKIATEQVLKVLEPIWTKIPETASRLRGRIETVLNAERARGHIPADRANPARWKDHLRDILPKLKTKIDRKTGERVRRSNFAAMDYRAIPTFMARLRQETSGDARALELLILCASRTGEVLGARWSEIDLEAGLWTLPPERLKTGGKLNRAHVVPLPPRAVEILVEMRTASTGDLIFPGRFRNKPLSHEALLNVLQNRLGHRNLTCHGFRSSFRDFAGDQTHHSRETCEMALAHVVGGVEGDYRRSDALEKRRALMAQWAAYCGEAPAPGLSADAPTVNVVPLRARRAS